MFNKKELIHKNEELNKQNEDLKNKLAMQNMALAQMNAEKRDMFMSPSDFVLSGNHKVWKDIKIYLNDKDITNNVTKLILFGPYLLM